MKRGNIKSGNVILRSEEIDYLRKAILEKYTELTGDKIKNPDRFFNSNLKNYWSVFDSIDSLAPLKAIGIRSTKPLAVIFHFSKTSAEGSTAFRKKFVDALYFYAFGCSRNEFGGQKTNFAASTVEMSQLNNLKGYWEYYYYKDARFSETLLNKNEASLDVIAFTINGDNIKNAVVEYYRPRNWGSGSLNIQGSNFILQLKRSKDNEPTFQIMNCGKNIEDFAGYVKYAAGIALYINDFGSVKAAKCLMVHYDANRLMEKYGLQEVDLSDENFRKKFQPELKIFSSSIGDELEGEIRRFFEKGINTTDVDISDFQSVD